MESRHPAITMPAAPRGPGDGPRSRHQPLGREYFTSLKAAGPVPGLPPLCSQLFGPTEVPVPEPTLTANSPMQRALTGQSHREEHVGVAEAGDAVQETALADSALVAFATRVGQMQGLPELRVLIQEAVDAAVSNTCRGIKGIVEHQVNRTLETSKFGIVEEMVIRLLTDEVVRVTEGSAQQMTDARVASATRTIRHIENELKKTSSQSREQFDELVATIQNQSDRIQEQASEAKQLRQALSSIEGKLGCLPTFEKGLTKVSRGLAEVQVAHQDARREARTYFHKLPRLEEQCKEDFVTKHNFAQAVANIEALQTTIEERDDKWLQKVLQPYAIQEDLERRLAEMEQRITDQSGQLQARLVLKVEEVGNAAQVRHDERLESELSATRAMLADLAAGEQRARKELEQAWSAQLSELRGQVATQSGMDVALETQRSAYSSLADEIRQSHAEVEGQTVTLQKRVSEAVWQLEEFASRFHATEHSLDNFAGLASKLEQDQKLLREHFSDEKMRVASIGAQQQQNRMELNHCIKRLQDVEHLGAEMQIVRATSDEYAILIEALQKEVSQWDDAIVAQQGLRHEIAKFQKEFAVIRTSVADIEKQQAVDSANLRAMHTTMLEG